VTGGSRGIGKATAREFALEGMDVVIASRNREDLQAAADELSRETGGSVRAVACDTGNDASVRSLVETAFSSMGGIDVLVNCAAQTTSADPPALSDITDEVFWSDMNVKVMGYLRCIRAVVPRMVASGGGRIINISGMGVRRTGATLTSVRNASVTAMTKNLSDELAPQGVTLVVVYPGTTRTESTPRRIRAQAALLGVSEAEAERRMAQRNSLGRLIDAREVAQVLTFLASPKSFIINGDVVAVGGGSRGSIHY
jgi:NAD(P)-dependent dehydrogenase (short-subunit alcohol dehydrogenase family)